MDTSNYPSKKNHQNLQRFFLLLGRYHYLRAPMGLSSSSDEWCCQSDQAIEGLTFTRKVVDDILIWASTIPELMERIRNVAERCRKMNIILLKKKFQSEVNFPLPDWSLVPKEFSLILIEQGL